MTKRTMKSALAVFEYCVKAALLAKREGILALEYLCLDKGITDTGEILFSRKVDKFLAWMLRSIVDGGYSLEANKSYVNSLCKYCRKRTKLLLNIASVCMDCIATGKSLDKLVADILPFVGVENQKVFWNLLFDFKVRRENDFEFKITEEQKKRIIETNVFFKMKEDECHTLMKQKNEKLSELHLRVPELKKQDVFVRLIYKLKNCTGEEGLYSCCMPDKDQFYYKRSKEAKFIGEIPVCTSLSYFWYNHHNCDRDIKKFMELTDDIPNNIEKNLAIKSTIRLVDEE